MGILDSILGSVTGKKGGGVNPALVNAVMGLLGDKQTGGLNGLVEQLTKNGLGDIVGSWVSTGKNLPVTPEQLAQGLGKDKLGQLASQAGMSTTDLTSSLSKLLPDMVDKLTPQGKVPTGDLLQQGLGMLKGKFGL